MKYVIFIVTIFLCITACKTTSKNQSKSLQYMPSNLQGNFVDDYGISYTITQKEWKQGSKTKYHLLIYNKEGNYIIAQNDAANPTDGNLYTRIDIMPFENMLPWQWGYCLTAYKAATLKDAINTASANRENPRKGCNGYPFSRMKNSIK